MVDAVRDINVEMWLFTVLVIGTVIVQSLLFLRLALNFNKKHKLITKEETKGAIRTSIISTIATTFIPVNTLALIALVGSAVTYMRVGVIGASGMELLLAQIGTSTAGVEFNTPEFTTNILVLCLFCMAFGSAPYAINCILMLKPLDKMVEKEKASGNKVSFSDYMAKGALVGVLASLALDRTYNNPVKQVAFLFALVLVIVVSELARKKNKSSMRGLLTPIGMLTAMLVGQSVATYIG